MWIEHDGKGMPVDGESKVYVKCRDGWSDDIRTILLPAKYWHNDDPELSMWVHKESDYDIVAYRVV